MDQISKIEALINPVLETMHVQLYECIWRQEGSTKILQIAVMHEDGTMDIDTCTNVSEQLSLVMDEQDIIPYEYFLEVCSPGAERELRNEKEIAKAIHEFVYIKLKSPKAGLDEVKGTLDAVDETGLHITYMAKAVKKKIVIEKDNVALIRLSVKI